MWPFGKKLLREIQELNEEIEAVYKDLGEAIAEKAELVRVNEVAEKTISLLRADVQRLKGVKPKKTTKGAPIPSKSYLR